MKIDICLLACDSNEKYYSFFPYVKSFWENILGIKCILLFIGEEIPKSLQSLSDSIIIYKPIENMHGAFIAQNIRLLYPALLNCENGVIIADIDIIPLSKKYFIDQIEPYSNDSFINYTYESKCDHIKEYYMCYNVATPKIWSKIFGIKSLEDINLLLKNWYNKIDYVYNDQFRSKCKGFHNDQLMLYAYVKLYKNKILLPRHTRRLECNSNIIIDKKKLEKELKNDVWDDFHIPKKFYKEELNKILSYLLN